jgi:hypothetical protein
MEDSLKEKTREKNGRQPQKKMKDNIKKMKYKTTLKKIKPTKINLIGCDTIVN